MAALVITEDASQFQALGMTVSEGHQRFNAHIAIANSNAQSGGGTGELRMQPV
jgi:hypothetical protein